MKLLVTGSAGLIGSEAVKFYCDQGHDIIGIDNNMRRTFFGKRASTEWNIKLLSEQYERYTHSYLDIRHKMGLQNLFKAHTFDAVIHAAAQPSHDKAAQIPELDFLVNAAGTFYLLECLRKWAPEAVFVFLSTNKVYGDNPNTLFERVVQGDRYELHPDCAYAEHGFDETLSVDHCTHSLFGVSKLAADAYVQEYGRYFDLKTTVLRGGCLTGPAHSGAELHGFLAYLIDCIYSGKEYTIFGYNGLQVRDNIHSADLVAAVDEIIKNPRPGEVYNIGGSRHSNISMKEAINGIEERLQKKGNIVYSDTHRKGDHIWWISDVRKLQSHFPDWTYAYDIDRILDEMCEEVQRRKRNYNE